MRGMSLGVQSLDGLYRNVAVSAGGAGIALDGSTVIGASGSFGTNCTMSVAVGSSSNRAIVVVCAWQTFGSVPTVTFNTSETFAAVGTVDSGSLSFGAWVLVNPTNTTANVVVSWGSDEGFGTAAAQAFTGVDQTTPTTGWVTDLANLGSSISQSIGSVATDEYVIDVVSNSGDNAANSMGGSQTLLVNQGRGVASGAGGIHASYQTGASGTVAHTWTTDVADWSGGIFRLLPA